MWVSLLPLMQWYSIPNTALSSVVPSPVPLGFSPSAKINAWNGACLKRSGSVYMLGAAGGHNDYGGNEVNSLVLNVDTPGWTELRGPTTNSMIINGSEDGTPPNNTPTQLYLDGRPSSTHTYHSTQFIDALNRMVVFSSPGYSGASGAATPSGWGRKTDQINHAFNVLAGDWDIPSSIADFPVTGDFTSQLCVKHPYSDDVIVSKNYGSGATGGLYKWKAATNTWARMTTNARSVWYCGAAIDPKRNRMLIAGGYASGSPAEVRSTSTGEKQPVSFTGAWASTSNLSAYAAVEYDEALECYWTLDLFSSDGGATYQPRFFKVDAATWNVTQPTATGTGPIARQNGFHNSLRYVPELRGLVIADAYNGNVKFMRTAT